MLPLDSCAYVICSAGRGICASVVLEMIRRGNRREGGDEERFLGQCTWPENTRLQAGVCKWPHHTDTAALQATGTVLGTHTLQVPFLEHLPPDGAKIAPSHREHSVCLHSRAHAKSHQLCLMLCDAMDSCQAPVYVILQARILEWIGMPSFRGSS